MGLAADRYALLVKQLGAELGFAHGWKAKVADRLGIHPSYVTRIERGDRSGIGGAVIARADQRLRLDPAFFTDPTIGDEPSYRDFVRSPVATYARGEGAPSFEGNLEDALHLLVDQKMREEWARFRDLGHAAERGDREAARALANEILGSTLVTYASQVAKGATPLVQSVFLTYVRTLTDYICEEFTATVEPPDERD